MKSKWLFFFNVVVVCAFIGIGAVFLCGKARIDVKGNMEPILEKNVVALVNKIAKIDVLKGKKVEFRVANFGQNDDVVEPDRDNYDLNIIWLGSRKKLYLNYLDLYDYVFASSPLLVEFLRANKIKAYYLPLGDFREIKKIKNDDEKFFDCEGKQINLYIIARDLYFLDAELLLLLSSVDFLSDIETKNFIKKWIKVSLLLKKSPEKSIIHMFESLRQYCVNFLENILSVIHDIVKRKEEQL